MEIQELLALNLRRIRVSKGISQDELALRAGVERAYVGHIERGVKNPTVQTLSKLSAALECDIRDFFETNVDVEGSKATLSPGRRSG